MPSFFPERAQLPNTWQAFGSALTQGAGILDEYQQKQNLLRDMVERRAQANIDAQMRAAEDARQQAVFDEGQKKKANVKEFGQFATTKTPTGPVEPLIQPPENAAPYDVQPGFNGMSPFIKPREMAGPDYSALQDKAIGLGVTDDPAVREYLNDKNPLNDPDFIMNKVKAQGTGNRAPSESMGRVAQKIAQAAQQGIQLSKQDLAGIMAQEDPTGAIFGTREGQGLMASRSTEEAMANATIAAQRFGFDQEKFGYTQGQDKKESLAKFAKNTSEAAGIDYLFKQLDSAIPGGIYGQGGVSGFGFGTKPLRSLWKTEEANRIRPILQSLVNKILKKQSGAAVTDQEFDRLQTEFGINTTGTVEEFRQGLQNAYELNRQEYDTFRAADPEAASILDERMARTYGAISGSPNPASEPPKANTMAAKPGMKAVDRNTAADYLKRAGGDRKKAKLMLKKDGYDING
jgi:hypothetical protein